MNIWSCLNIVDIEELALCVAPLLNDHKLSFLSQVDLDLLCTQSLSEYIVSTLGPECFFSKSVCIFT